jgi:Tfp pilus assembly PilM family ATPase
MNWLANRSRSLIGVAVDSRCLKAVQLLGASAGRRSARASASAARLAAAIRLPRVAVGDTVSRAEVAELCGAMARQGFAGTRIVLGVPETKIVTGILELPPRASGAPLADIARLELASMNGYDAAQAETVSWDLPPSPRLKNATQAMAVSCRHADAEALIEVFEGAGLQVVALDSPVHALVRACRPRVSPTGLTGILELEWDSAVLILLLRGVVIYRWSMAEASVRHLVKALGAGLSLDEAVAEPLLADVGLVPPADVDAALAEAVAASIRKHLDRVVESIASPLQYAGQQYPGTSVDNLLVVGGGAAIPGVAGYLQSRVAGQVKVIGPADLLTCPPALAEKSHDPALVGAVGLAQFEG